MQSVYSVLSQLDEADANTLMVVEEMNQSNTLGLSVARLTWVNAGRRVLFSSYVPPVLNAITEFVEMGIDNLYAVFPTSALTTVMQSSSVTPSALTFFDTEYEHYVLLMYLSNDSVVELDQAVAQHDVTLFVVRN